MALPGLDCISSLQTVTRMNVELSKLSQPETQRVPTCKRTGSHIRSITTLYFGARVPHPPISYADNVSTETG